MLQSPIQPSSYSLRQRRKSETETLFLAEPEPPVSPMADDFDDDDDAGSEGGGGAKGRNKSRRELPAGAVATLKAWLLSPEHFTHPYPTPQDQAMLMQKTGIDKKQLKNWFTNARRRIWKPMLKKQIEQGKLPTTGHPGMPGAHPGLVIPAISGAAPTAGLDNPHSIQAMRTHYQQAVQQQEQSQQQQQRQQAASADSYNNPVFTPLTASADAVSSGQYYVSQPASESNEGNSMLNSTGHMNKTDSHAVLMELFARDQDLVRQATESARLKAESKQLSSPSPASSGNPSSQHPMKTPSSQSSLLNNVPTLNSWPHFSSINSLNNLGTIPGVKSITSLSGADLASKGNVNRMGNLAQVKSMESMGRNDSYAFLEVFFGDRSSTNLSSMGGKDNRGMMKQTGEEDNEIGLSLEDETPSQITSSGSGKREPVSANHMSGSVQSMPLSSSGDESTMDSGTLKRAYDDALAARGLISVSRSCEKLTDLVLPAKMQRTLSQEFISKQSGSDLFGSQFIFTSGAPANSEHSSSHQYPGQQPVEPQSGTSVFSTDHFDECDGQVHVPAATTCALCLQTNVDTQLRPCGHMFHERCLKPSLQTPLGPPKCPIDDIPMHSAVLAVPTDEGTQAPKEHH